MLKSFVPQRGVLGYLDALAEKASRRRSLAWLYWTTLHSTPPGGPRA